MRRGGPILVIEDDDALLDLMEIVLVEAHYRVVKASNGLLALEEMDKGVRPQLILLDMRMPLMDGWAFARAYRARPEPLAPIVVVTAAQDAASRAGEIQADGHLSKPFDVDQLLALVGHYTRVTGRMGCSLSG